MPIRLFFNRLKPAANHRGLAPNPVYALAVEPDGNVLIGGIFNQVGGGNSRVDMMPRQNVAQLIGQPAAIITPIPENGVGEISYVQFGSRYTAPARNDAKGPIANGQTVRIKRIVGTQFFVEQLT